MNPDTEKHVIQCPHCGCEALDHMQSCPVCGKPLRPNDEGRISEQQIKKLRTIFSVIAWIVVAGIVIWKYFL